MVLLTTISPRKWLLITVTLLIACALLSMVSSLSRRSSSALRIAPDLLAVHRDMTQDGLSGFLPGNHSRLTERIRAKRFNFVTVMPIMVQAGRMGSVGNFRFGTSIVLMRLSEDTNKWEVSKTIHLGQRSWTTKIATISATEQ